MEEFFDVDFWHNAAQATMDWAIVHLPKIVVTVLLMFLVLFVFKFFIKRLRKIMIAKTLKAYEENSAEKEKRINTLLDIVKQAGKVIIVAIFLMMVLKSFGLDIAPILAGAGILGLAVGFGAQELVRDFITGFFILLENQVRTGDVAIINGTGGLVEHIELRTITLRDLAGVTHVFQNGKINTLANMTKEWSAYVFDIGVAYKENTDEVIKVIKELDEEFRQDENFKKLILEPIEIFGVDKFGDSAVVIKARYKTRPIHQWNVGREFNRRIKHAFDQHNIEIPFPHQTIYWGEDINPLRLKMDENLKVQE